MSTDLQPLMFKGHNVRTVIQMGVLWFFLNDVCKVLGLSNPSQVASRLRDDMKSSITLNDGTPGNPDRVLVNERGVFKIIMRSDKPFAEEFQDAVFEYVQSIGKHGVALAHISEAEMAEGLADPESAVLFEMFKERIARKALERRTNEIEKQMASLGELRNSYMSIVGWFNYNDGTVSNDDAQILGKIASKICRKRGIKIGTVKHERWGSVQSYPEAVIAEAYEQFRGR